MKKILMAAVFFAAAGAVCAADFSDLSAFKVSGAKPVPVLSGAVRAARLSIPETVEAAGTTVVNSQEGSYTLRYVLEKYDIYPQLRVEIYQKGYEGEPTVINAVIEVYPGSAPDSDFQIEGLKWSGYALNFEVNGKKCALDLGENFSKVGKNFENAASLKYSCSK